MINIMTVALIAFLAMFQTVMAEYPGWKQSGSLFIVTTPEGANLPATAREEGFPLLVRLSREWFDFSQAKPNGDDLRFAGADGTPLAYQIDDWDTAAGTACIWVRIPVVKGNAHQEIKMFWGKADAASESSGSAVFNESNGYLSVMHMDDPGKDEVGTLKPRDMGTAPSAGVFGKGRHFETGKGINCGETITRYPAGSSPHSSELWLKYETPSDRIFCWGNGGPKAVVQMIMGKPPHIFMDCYGSSAGVSGSSRLGRGQWIHIIHTCRNGDSRLYVNGLLDAVSTAEGSPLDIKSPVKAYIGGWDGHYVFNGDLDEVRVSRVARSADWVKLQYENQKPLQTVVGPLVQPGAEFSVSAKKLTLKEGATATLTAKAGGAVKVYWIIKSAGLDTIAAADIFDFKVDAGRVMGDQSFTLQFKAVYPDKVKILDIPVTVQEDIPDPVFSLKAPVKWNGRDAIEVVPQISNMAALQAKNGGALKYQWAAAGLAVIKDAVPGKLILRRGLNSGKLLVTATVSNGGTPITQTAEIAVKEPKTDKWVERVPDKDEKPVDNQFYARDDKGEGTLHYNGMLSNAADAVFLKVYADDKLIKTLRQTVKADKQYAFAVKIKAGLIRYKVEFGLKSEGSETVLDTVTNLVCGDAYIIDGQSNAVAYNYRGETNRLDLTHFSSPWIRSFGGNGESGGDPTHGGWGNAVIERLTPTSPDRIHFIGVWGLALAKKLVEDEKIPVCILNGALGGTRIDQHMPDPANHYDTTNRAYSIYGNLLTRVAAARLTHGIRGVLWHQGEADQGYDGPDDCYGCEMYQKYWLDLTAAWKLDMPNLKYYYFYQIWPNACSQGGTKHSDTLRDIQRCFTRLYSGLSVMPTMYLPSGSSCHFTVEDYEKMGLSMAPLLERDSCGRVFDKPVSSPDLKKAYYTSDRKDEIALEFDQPMAWDDSLVSEFHLDGEHGGIAEGSVSGNVVKLKLAVACSAKSITYLVDKQWNPKVLLYGQNGIAALTFAGVEIK